MTSTIVVVLYDKVLAYRIGVLSGSSWGLVLAFFLLVIGMWIANLFVVVLVARHRHWTSWGIVCAFALNLILGFVLSQVNPLMFHAGGGLFGMPFWLSLSFMP